MVSDIHGPTEQSVDPEILRGAAVGIRMLGLEVAANHLDEAAGEIEGHTEAYRTLVDEKRALQAKLARAETNLRGAHELIRRWRELLVALQDAQTRGGPAEEWGGRIARALRGEEP
ncbi:hypothetical protein [Burkholderia sp. MBR-1]|uniref:hypothetical protein n=1 Tax=Burkholderia sp. MBR-1 TaxID=2732364 RepID=UPI0015EF2E39|nr:hypothetical protein [Burkholderia sp. MBR-1]QMI49676.1 hypothetical protein MBR110_29990 [Burkholderia sp. MBR-1]